MQTIWVRISRLFLIASLLVSQSAYADEPSGSARWAVEISTRGSLLVRNSLVRPPQVVKLQPQLMRVLTNIEQVVLLGGQEFAIHGRRYLVLGIAQSSISQGGPGYCGAGTEDQLLLLEWMYNRQTLVLRDHLLVQSCLLSFVLSGDQGNDLTLALASVVTPYSFTLSWLNHPQYGSAEKHIQVMRGRFVMR